MGELFELFEPQKPISGVLTETANPDFTMEKSFFSVLSGGSQLICNTVIINCFPDISFLKNMEKYNLKYNSTWWRMKSKMSQKLGTNLTKFKLRKPRYIFDPLNVFLYKKSLIHKICIVKKLRLKIFGVKKLFAEKKLVSVKNAFFGVKKVLA